MYFNLDHLCKPKLLVYIGPLEPLHVEATKLNLYCCLHYLRNGNFSLFNVVLVSVQASLPILLKFLLVPQKLAI